jgi:hypothetical protein
MPAGKNAPKGVQVVTESAGFAQAVRPRIQSPPQPSPERSEGPGCGSGIT